VNSAILKNFVAFQLVWFASVLGAAKGYPLLGPLLLIPLLAWHLSTANRPVQELRLLLISLLVGTLFEVIPVIKGWIAYPEGTLFGVLPPLWMLGLWLLFAITLNVSLRWMRRYLPVAVLFGLIGAPLAYWGGSRLGAFHITAPLPYTVTLALAWGGLMPFLIKISEHYDGFAGAKHVG